MTPLQQSPAATVLAPPTARDPAACGDCALVPGSPQRVRQMQALREQGWSLDEIALRFGVSRERVRQILRAHGGPEPQDIADARRRRAEAQAEERVDELLALWRTGEQPRSAADKLASRSPRAVARSAASRPTSTAPRARRTSRAQPRADVLRPRHHPRADLRRDARRARVPSAKDYATHARELNHPSLPTILNRMGGWAHALRAAGMEPLSTPRRARRRRWTEESCWAALLGVVDELAAIPTVLAYERHAAGRPELPSSATLRNRLGRWSSITTQLAAQRELVRAMTPEPERAPPVVSAARA